MFGRGVVQDGFGLNRSVRTHPSTLAGRGADVEREDDVRHRPAAATAMKARCRARGGPAGDSSGGEPAAGAPVFGRAAEGDWRPDPRRSTGRLPLRAVRARRANSVEADASGRRLETGSERSMEPQRVGTMHPVVEETALLGRDAVPRAGRHRSSSRRSTATEPSRRPEQPNAGSRHIRRGVCARPRTGRRGPAERRARELHRGNPILAAPKRSPHEGARV